ncbi:hypothetical protein GALMADRAFT_63602 [Galerina marginata CBS 339.88]|uniref:RING-type domain-containing protein n=1 Tax=Galerina marginata (strain CBS 339.88) TaxID=685588 RepID=A0A067T7P7_GALM3|nr:hypothetical protein GALMADRAFT_63602 [Galerina marginata CBS 339.88]
MLSLTTGSSCDICFERFGQDRKAPTSIACGHVFCNACISQISRLCPLCRTPFDQRTCIKLHVDLETEQQPGCSPEDVQRAQKLQQSIASIADDGISEANLRQLIQEGKTFLHSQPRNLHKDLRVAHRMISYLCEVKATLRSQNQAVEMLTDQAKQLTQEKADLRGEIAQLQEARRYEKETALAVEKSLRDHYEEAVNVYRSTLEYVLAKNIFFILAYLHLLAG